MAEGGGHLRPGPVLLISYSTPPTPPDDEEDDVDLVDVPIQLKRLFEDEIEAQPDRCSRCFCFPPWPGCRLLLSASLAIVIIIILLLR